MGTVTSEFVDDVAIVTTSNLPANTFDESITDGLATALAEAAERKVRAMVIQADGPLFSGGADVNLFHGTSGEQAHEMFTRAFETVVWAIEAAPYPVIAATHGMCLAAGLEIALASDLIIAAEGTQFAQVEQFIGATTFLGGVNRLTERAGSARAAEIVFSGATYDAETFERWNIINRVVPADELRDSALEWARRLAKGPTAAHAATKDLIRRTADQGVQPADRHLIDTATGLFDSRDMQHAVGLMLEQGPKAFMRNHDDVGFEGR